MKKQSSKQSPEESAIDHYKMQTVDQMVKYFSPDVGRKTGNVMTQSRFRLVCETLYEEFVKEKPLRYVDPIPIALQEVQGMDEMELLSMIEKWKETGPLVVSKPSFEVFLNGMHQWQKETFPTATPLSKLYHLLQEVRELIEALQNNEAPTLEYADCLLLLFGAMYADGYDLNDAQNFMKDKLEICKTREWGPPDENGVVNHIKKKFSFCMVLRRIFTKTK